MNVDESYSIVLYNGLSSKTITGTLVAILNRGQLTRYGQNATQLMLYNRVHMPRNITVREDEGVWYVMAPTGGGELQFIHSSWIKTDGISSTSVKTNVITGTFTSGRPLDELSAAFIREGLYSVSLTQITGEVETEGSELAQNVLYKMTLADSEKSSVWGNYLGSVNHSLLPAMNLNGAMEYSTYTWDTDHRSQLSSYTWLVFSSPDNADVKFAIAKELITEGPSQAVNQGQYSLQCSGSTDIIPHIRSVLNIQSCTNITLGILG